MNEWEFVKNCKPNFEIYVDNEQSKQSAQKPFESNAVKFRKKNEQSPPLARFEKPDPFKKYVFDEKKIYFGGHEFSFEEIRGRKWLAAKNRELEDARNRKLEEEVSQLRQQIALLLIQQKNDEKVKLTKEISSSTNTAQMKATSPAPTVSSAETSSAKSISNTCESKGEIMSMIRELWNGTLANNEEQIGTVKPNAIIAPDSQKNHKILIYSDNNNGEERVDLGKKRLEKIIDKNNIEKKTDDENENENDCVYDAFSIAMPKNEDEFVALCATQSTPMVDKRVRKLIDVAVINNTINCNNNVNFVGGMTAKLSPIVETSREYYSKSSSSSGTNSTKLSNRCRSSRSEKHSRNMNA